MNISNLPLDEWLIHVEKHVARRPGMQSRDVYKLLYQGLLGPEHLIDSPEAFAERLHKEYDGLSTDQSDPLYEAIRPDQALLRVNLRPFKASRLDLDSLLDVCLKTAGRTWGDPADLGRLWASFAGAYRQRPFGGFTPDELDEFTALLSTHDYPAVHHSKVYSETYSPAYRLVAADLAIM